MASKAIPVTRSSMPPFEEYVDEIRGLWDSHWLSNMGEKHQAFEKELERYLGVDDIALFVNGHQALECVLEAMELEGKVITTPYTFASTTHAIVRKGLEPVFCDIRPDDYTMDPERIEGLIDEDTCAIVPVHVYGNLCDTDAIETIAARYGLKVIYDAAHAFGVWRNGVSAALLGDASMFSFHATKAFNSIEGGAVCFADPSVRERLDQWKNFGITGVETCEYIGGNAKMNEFVAAMGICNLRHLDEELAKRKAVAERYWEHLDGVRGVRLSKPAAGTRPNHAYMPVVFDDAFAATRDQVYDTLMAHDIHARKYFYPLTTDLACYAGRFDPSATPIAANIASRVLTLPMYADLALEDVDRICDIVLGEARS